MPNEGIIDVLEPISYTLGNIREWSVHHPLESAKVVISTTKSRVCLWSDRVTLLGPNIFSLEKQVKDI